MKWYCAVPSNKLTKLVFCTLVLVFFVTDLIKKESVWTLFFLKQKQTKTLPDNAVLVFVCFVAKKKGNLTAKLLEDTHWLSPFETCLFPASCSCWFWSAGAGSRDEPAILTVQGRRRNVNSPLVGGRICSECNLALLVPRSNSERTGRCHPQPDLLTAAWGMVISLLPGAPGTVLLPFWVLWLPAASALADHCTYLYHLPQDLSDEVKTNWNNWIYH